MNDTGKHDSAPEATVDHSAVPMISPETDGRQDGGPSGGEPPRVADLVGERFDDTLQFRDTLPDRGRVSLGDAISFALYGMVPDGKPGDVISIVRLATAATPAGILYGTAGDEAEQRESAFFEALHAAASNGKIKFFGRKPEPGEPDDLSRTPGSDPIDPSCFDIPRIFDWAAGTIDIDPSKFSGAEQDRVALVIARGSQAIEREGLFSWEGVCVERPGFLAWLAAASSASHGGQMQDERATPHTGTTVAGQAPVPCVVQQQGAENRRHNGQDYRADDQPWLGAMHSLIERRGASSPEKAARAVLNRVTGGQMVAGGGTPDSKVKRLAKHYREKFPV